jgi:Phosphoribosylpyrophosphate synthetase
MARYLVASFQWSSDVGNEIASSLGFAHVILESKQFPDGESYIRYPIDITTYDGLILVQRAYPNQDTRLFQAMLAVDAARDVVLGIYTLSCHTYHTQGRIGGLGMANQLAYQQC